MFQEFTRFHFYWGVLITLCTSFLAIFIPLEIDFTDLGSWYSVVKYTISFIYLIDIPVTYRYFIKEEKDLIFTREFGSGNYLKKWLAIDLISVLPWGLLFGPMGEVLRLVKLIKIGSFMHFTRQRVLQYNYLLLLLFFGFWLIHSAHWVSCGWLFLRGPEPDLNNATNYIKSLYWCMTTLTSVGYGDIVPVTNPERIYAMVVQLLGVGVFAFVIGNIATIIAKKNPATSKYLENVEKLSALLHFRHLPPDLQSKIQQYYIYMWKKKMGYDETTFLEDLPDNLKRQVALSLKQEVLERIPLFRLGSEDFIREISLHLKPLVLIPEDYVFKAGDKGRAMFFVLRGELQALDKDETKVLATLRDGDFFGEIALFRDIPRTATIKAVTYCDLYSLDKKAFLKIIESFPEIGQKIEEEALKREKN